MTKGRKIDINETHLNGARTLAYTKEQFAQFAFEAARRWGVDKQSKLTSSATEFDALPETEKDFYGSIAEEVARWTIIGDAARFAVLEEMRPLEATFAELVRAVEFARRRLMSAAVDDQMRIIQGGGREWERRIWSSFAEFDAIMHGQITASESTPVYESAGSEDWKPRYTGSRLRYEMAEARRRGQMDVIEILEQKAEHQRQYFDEKQLSLPGIEDLTNDNGDLLLPADVSPLLEERTAHGRFLEADWWLNSIQALKIDLFTKGHRPFDDNLSTKSAPMTEEDRGNSSQQEVDLSIDTVVSRIERALAAGPTAGPWYEGHLHDDDHSCNCASILSDTGIMGAVASVHVDNGLPVGEGGNDAPEREEAKANQKFIAACNPAAIEVLLKKLKRMQSAITLLKGKSSEPKTRFQLSYMSSDSSEGRLSSHPHGDFITYDDYAALAAMIEQIED